MNTAVAKHGDELGGAAANLNAVGDKVDPAPTDLAEFMDPVPLMMQNLGSTVGPDRRGRIRLNVSSALTQFAAAENFASAPGGRSAPASASSTRCRTR